MASGHRGVINHTNKRQKPTNHHIHGPSRHKCNNVTYHINCNTSKFKRSVNPHCNFPFSLFRHIIPLSHFFQFIYVFPQIFPHSHLFWTLSLAFNLLFKLPIHINLLSRFSTAFFMFKFVLPFLLSSPTQWLLVFWLQRFYITPFLSLSIASINYFFVMLHFVSSKTFICFNLHVSVFIFQMYIFTNKIQTDLVYKAMGPFWGDDWSHSLHRALLAEVYRGFPQPYGKCREICASPQYHLIITL